MKNCELAVGIFPFRHVAILSLCVVLQAISYARIGNILPFSANVLAFLVFGCAFYCEYNRSVKWDAAGIRHRWRGAGYLFWIVDRDYIPIADLVAVHSDRGINPWEGNSPRTFSHFIFATPEKELHLHIGYFRREGFEDLLKFVREARPEVVFDEDALEFMNGGFVERFPYRINWAKEWERAKRQQGLE